VLLAYGKLTLFEDIVGSTAPDDPWFELTLRRYFPEPLAQYEDAMGRHRLRREIISTVLANDMVNMGGPTFAPRLRSSAGVDTSVLVVAFEAARRIFRLHAAWLGVNALDLQAPAAAQTALYLEITRVLRRQTFWLARGAGRAGATVQGLIDAYRGPADALQALGAEPLSDFERAEVDRRAAKFIKAGRAGSLAHELAVLRPADGDHRHRRSGVSGRGVPSMRRRRCITNGGGCSATTGLRAAAGGGDRGDHFERMACAG
jgi:glutamate dehydrogenase